MLLKKYFKARYLILTRVKCEEGLWCQLCKYWDFSNTDDHRTCKQHIPTKAKLFKVYDHCIHVLYDKLKIFPKHISIGNNYTYVIKED